MAFSYTENNLANLDQWTFRQSASFFDDDSWMSMSSASSSSILENETLTKALQQSFVSFSSNDHSSEPTLAAVHQFVKPEQTPTVSVSGISGSDPETTTTTTTSTSTSSKQRRNHQHQILKAGKISKRKSRAMNRSPITFISTDPINFREMVQQVTGIRIDGSSGNSQMLLPVVSSSSQVIKPAAAKRACDLLMLNGGYTLPTLDTSAFLLEQQLQLQQQQQQQQQQSTTSSTVTSPTHVVSYHAPVVAQVNPSFDFDSFQSFPTLESWGVI